MNVNKNPKEKILHIFVEVLHLEAKEVLNGSGLVKRLSIQSLQTLQLIVKIESEFGIIIMDEEEMILKLDDIDELQQYIDTLLK